MNTQRKYFLCTGIPLTPRMQILAILPIKGKTCTFQVYSTFCIYVLYWLFGCFEDFHRLSDISAISQLRNRSGETGIEFWTFLSAIQELKHY